jgi:hypothetical protein
MNRQALRARLVPGLALAAAALAATGCGGGRSERSRVNDYVDRADAVIRADERALTAAQQALDGFARSTPSEQAALRRAEASSERLLRRVRRLHAPAAAADVQRRLEALAAAQAAAAAAAADLHAYLAAERRPEAQLRTAEIQLSRALSGSRSAAVQEQAFSTFAARVTAVRAEFAAIPAAGAALAWRQAQVGRLTRLRSAATRLHDALAHRDARAMQTGLAELQAEVAGVDAVAAERRAVGTYERLVARADAAQTALSVARQRLSRRFG